MTRVYDRRTGEGYTSDQRSDSQRVVVCGTVAVVEGAWK